MALKEDQFLRDVQHHEMTVLRDDGVYRHLRFGRTGTIDRSFQLVTWPGSLCYTGDMGTFVFARTQDMLEFFRSSGHNWRDGRTLYINPSYWSEKAQAGDRWGSDTNCGITKFSVELFRSEVLRLANEFAESRGLTEVETAHLMEELRNEVLDRSDEDRDEATCRRSAEDFKYRGRAVFPDFFEVRLDVWTQRYEWCCYALAWAVRKYDAAKSGVLPADAATSVIAIPG